MPKKVVKTFSVEYMQILDENGNEDSSLMPSLTNDDLRTMYWYMLLMRAFDNKCFKLQRSGRMGTYAQVTGQDATQVGAAYAMQKRDWLFPTYRESGILLARGMPIHLLMQYWAGDERGQKIPDGENDLPIAISIASQIPHAVGAAWGFKMQGMIAATVTFFGDGATSKGDFHEAMNFAGVFRLPAVFICVNNQFAISLARSKQTASETLAQKAIAYGIPSLQVDGNDVFSVYKATKEALQRAYNGEGPTLIEMMTYRTHDHTTSDDSSRYRSKEEVEAWKKKDPVERLRRYMQKRNAWDEQYEKDTLAAAERDVENAWKKVEGTPEQDVEDIFKYVFSEMPQNLKDQLEYARKYPLEKKE